MNRIAVAEWHDLEDRKPAYALANSALQAIGCLGIRACHTNNCPVGIATQRADLTGVHYGGVGR